jgi:hypothetical protein
MTDKLGRTALDEGSVHRNGLYLYDTQRSQETNIHTPSGILTHSPSKRAASDPHLRLRSHRDRLEGLITVSVTEVTEYSVIGRSVTNAVNWKVCERRQF